MDDAAILATVIPVAFLLILYFFRSLKQINQWETALKFTLGKYSGKLEPGLNVVWPGFQKLYRIDTRVRNRDLPRQMVITKDNVTAAIDAVVYYKVVDVEKAALNVENFETAVKDRAKVVLRDVVGETELDDVLSHREEVAAKIRRAVEQFVSQWGIHVELVALQDIQLPAQMQEVIARKAIAQRDRQYVIIKSQADVESAKNFAEAARILAESPGAMELRRLEALQNITNSGTSKVVFDLARPDTGGRHDAIKMAVAMADDVKTEATGVRVETRKPIDGATRTRTATDGTPEAAEIAAAVANAAAATVKTTRD